MDNTRNKIELYLLDRLDKAEVLEFESAMQADPSLSREVERMRAIVTAFEKRGERQALRAMQRIDSEETLKSIIKQAEKGSTRRHTTARIYGWSAAAAAAVILLAWIGTQPEYPSTELYNNTFTAQQQFDVAPSRGTAAPQPENAETLSTALALYRMGNFATAADTYAKALQGIDEREIAEDVYLYYATALLQTDRMDEAIRMLRSMAANDEAELQDEARWNLALALLKEGQRRASIDILDELIQEQGAFATRAKTLKTKIEKRRWF